jgi:hypothetical protein
VVVVGRSFRKGLWIFGGVALVGLFQWLAVHVTKLATYYQGLGRRFGKKDSLDWRLQINPLLGAIAGQYTRELFCG